MKYYVILKSKYRPPWGQDVCYQCNNINDANRILNEASFYGGYRYVNIRKSKPQYNIEIIISNTGVK